MNAANLGDQLARGIDQMGLQVPADIRQQLLNYLGLLHKWNNAYNLSGVRDMGAMVSRHLLDSLTLLPFMDAATESGLSTGAIMDIGTGPGLPGIPLALCYPQRDVVLLDSNGKKTRFLFQVQLALKLDNIHIVNKRIEHYSPDREIDTITSRAFSTLAQLLASSDHVGARHMLAMKGEFPTQELVDMSALSGPASPGWQVLRTEPVAVPGNDARRHVVELARGRPGQ